jgi:TATA-box binding protein (TBP) (component of TFIID and TFIIIB)
MNINYNAIIKNLIDQDKLSLMDIKVIKFIHFLQNSSKNKPKESPIKVVTRSCSAKLNQMIDPNKLSQLLYKDINEDIINNKINNIIGVQYKNIDIKNNIALKNYSSIIKKKNKLDLESYEYNDDMSDNFKNRKFNNCCSIIIKATDNSNVNMKIFTNSSITMTGCIDELSDKNALKIIINYINKNRLILLETEEDIRYEDLRVSMLNCNFSFNFMINREKLFEILTENYKFFVSYEPEKYQGIKINYMYNKNNINNDGICYCKKKCKGKGINTDCKRITIAIFQSGITLINGATNIEQVIIIYKFMLELVDKHFNDIVRYSILYFNDSEYDFNNDYSIDETNIYNKKKLKFIKNSLNNNNDNKVVKKIIKVKDFLISKKNIDNNDKTEENIEKEDNFKILKSFEQLQISDEELNIKKVKKIIIKKD